MHVLEQQQGALDYTAGVRGDPLRDSSGPG